MSGVVSSIGQGLFGSADNKYNDELMQAGRDQYSKGMKNYDQYMAQYEKYRQEADNAIASDMGSTGAEYMGKTMEAGKSYANKLTQGQSNQAQQAAQKASRQAGMSRSAAALQGAGAQSEVFGQNYLSNVGAGQGLYQNSVNQFVNTKMNQQGQASNQAGNAANLASAGTNAMGAGASNYQTERDKNMGVIGAIGGLLSSDGNQKEPIKQETDDERSARLNANPKKKTKEEIQKEIAEHRAKQRQRSATAAGATNPTDFASTFNQGSPVRRTGINGRLSDAGQKDGVNIENLKNGLKTIYKKGEKK